MSAMIRGIFFVFLALVFGSQSTAEENPYQNTTTSSFGEVCKNEEGWGMVYCLGYLDSMYEALSAMEWTCPPSGVTSGQIRKIFLKWVDENPENLHQSRRLSVAAAFVEVFPCEGKDAEQLTPEQALDQFIDSILNETEETPED